MKRMIKNRNTVEGTTRKDTDRGCLMAVPMTENNESRFRICPEHRRISRVFGWLHELARKAAEKKAEAGSGVERG